jgi:hypothetical protein
MRDLCLLLATCALLAGCDATALEAPDLGPAGGQADGPGEPGTDHGEVPRLHSYYALYLESAVEVRDIETWERTTLASRSGVLLAVVQEEAAVRMSAQPCYVELPEVGGYRPTLDGDMVEALEPVAIDAALVPREDGVWLVTDPAAVQLGVDLDDPIADPLPVDGNDTAVVDHDEDEKPGVTVYASLWSVYVGARVIFALSALVDDPDLVAGRSEVSTDTEIYGDNIPFYSVRDAAADAAELSVVVSEEHGFSMRYLVADEWWQPSCASIR